MNNEGEASILLAVMNSVRSRYTALRAYATETRGTSCSVSINTMIRCLRRLGHPGAVAGWMGV